MFSSTHILHLSNLYLKLEEKQWRKYIIHREKGPLEETWPPRIQGTVPKLKHLIG